MGSNRPFIVERVKLRFEHRAESDLPGVIA